MLSWILDNLAVKPDDTIWITLNEQVDSQFALVERMQKEFPKYKIRPVHVHFQTRGAAETLYVTL
jgi:citrate lyase gamma subunit